MNSIFGSCGPFYHVCLIWYLVGKFRFVVIESVGRTYLIGDVTCKNLELFDATIFNPVDLGTEEVLR